VPADGLLFLTQHGTLLEIIDITSCKTMEYKKYCIDISITGELFGLIPMFDATFDSAVYLLIPCEYLIVYFRGGGGKSELYVTFRFRYGHLNY
jgi:hypothetical protein